MTIAAGDRLDALEVLRRSALPFARVVPHDLLGDRCRIGAQRGDRRQHFQRAEPRREVLDLLLDDPLGLAGLRLTHAAVARDHGLQIVDVKQRDAGESRRTRLSMSLGTARSMSSIGLPSRAQHHLREFARLEQQVGRGRRGDDDVRRREHARELVEADVRAPGSAWRDSIARSRRRLATNTVRHPSRRAPARSARSSRRCRRSRPHGRTGRRAARARARRRRRGGSAARSAIAVSLRTRLPVASAALNSRFVSGPDGLACERRLVGALDLTLDLVLADDHRVEPRGDPVQVAGGVAVAVRVDRAASSVGRIPAWLASIAEHRALGLDRARRRRGRARSGCRSRSRPPRARRRRRAGRAGTRRRACSGSASRSRTSTGAVLCETPIASSSLIRPAPLVADSAVGLAALARGRLRGRAAARPDRARCG